jgi:hypothetical protein
MLPKLFYFMIFFTCVPFPELKAQENLLRDLECSMYAGSNTRAISFVVRLPDADISKLADEKNTTKALEDARKIAAQICATRPDNIGGNQIPVPRIIERMDIYLTKQQGLPYFVKAHYSIPNASWQIEWNTVARDAEIVAKQTAQVEAEARRKEQIAIAERAAREQILSRISASRAVFDTFNTKAKVDDWPQARDLLANPSAFLDKVVAVNARYASNLNDDSIFAIEGGLICVSGVPATMTQTHESPLLIAAKVVGAKRVDWKGVAVSIPQLQFKDAYVCLLVLPMSENCERHFK